jgi:hypothetical protein
MPNISQKALDAKLHAAWIKGASAALAFIADDHRQPGMAADGLRFMMKPDSLKLAEPYDRERLKTAASEAWSNDKDQGRPQNT